MEFSGLAFLLWLMQQPAGPMVFGALFVLLFLRWSLKRIGV